MNGMQKFVLVLFFGFLTAACVYVPWQIVVGSNSFVKVASHYDYIWSKATVYVWGGREWPIGGVDITRLIAEIIGLIGAAGTLFYLFSFSAGSNSRAGKHGVNRPQ